MSQEGSKGSRMKTFISLVVALVSTFSLDAQITTTLNRSPNGLDEISIRNTSATSLVAFVVAAKQVIRSDYSTGAPFVEYSDSLLDTAAKPLLANEQRVVMVRGIGFSEPAKIPGQPIRHLVEEPVLAAGIFADGTTTGDTALLSRLISRRCSMLQAVETALEILSDAGNRNISREHLIAQFRKMADSVRRWYLPADQRVGLGVYQQMMGKLMNLPDIPVGAPFPPATFVTQETKRLNQQRVMLLESQPALEDANLISSQFRAKPSIN